jgi:hypothetical protein
MKFMTIDKWSGTNGDALEALKEYQRYLDSVFATLPLELQRFTSKVSLHDARMRHLRLAAGLLKLKLDGSGYQEETRSYFDRRFDLTYGGVDSLTSTADPDTGLPGPHGYGDLGYDEIEVLANGRYEHRMLFSTGIELHVQFNEFSFTYEDDKS